MKKIAFFFKQFNVGTLEFNGEYYIYNSNPQQEKLASQFASFSNYSLYNSVSLKSRTLFKEFHEIAKALKKRRDLIESANIKPDDGYFVRLMKFASVPQDIFGFHLKIAD